MRALLVVDLQNDFLPGGLFPVRNGDEILPLINEMVHYPFDVIVATKDWHPAEHGSFASNHAGKKVGDHIQLGGLDQILWPVHCVQGTKGSEFTSGWDVTRVDRVFYKGTDPQIDSYSTFFDNGHLKATGLDVYLREKGVTEIFIAGLTTDYCILYSVLDALKLGLHVTVIADACRGINVEPRDSEIAIETMRRAGAAILSFKDLKDVLEVGRKGLKQL